MKLTTAAVVVKLLTMMITSSRTPALMLSDNRHSVAAALCLFALHCVPKKRARFNLL